MRAVDLFGEVDVQEMKASILLAYAVNGCLTMSAAELQFCVRINSSKSADTWSEAVSQMARAGDLLVGTYQAGGWTVPAIQVAGHVRLPHDRARQQNRRRTC